MKKMKPSEKKRAYRELLMPFALLLIGLVLIIESAEVMLILSAIDTTSISSTISSTFSIGYIYTSLKLIAGIASMLAGVMILKK
jgi:hypothetical protein